MSGNTGHRYRLEKYKGPSTRYTCPSCGRRRVFARYEDTNEWHTVYIADHVGRCNREADCGYHYAPKQFFADNPHLKPEQNNYTGYNVPVYNRPAPANRPKVDMPRSIMEGTLKRNSDNNYFAQFLLNMFEPCVAYNIMRECNIGTADGAAWWGTDEQKGRAVVFWFINQFGAVRSGQVKLFKPDGHTAKWVDHEGEQQSCTGWAHDLMTRACKANNTPLPEWLTNYRNQDVYTDCFFNEHLLTQPKYINKPVAVHESPKACVLSMVMLPEFVHIAAGSLSYLTPERCQVLKGRKVVLFSDLGKISDKPEQLELPGWEADKGVPYNKWKQRAQELSHIAAFIVSDILERIATPELRAQGYDIADYLSSDAARAELMDDYKRAVKLFLSTTVLAEDYQIQNEICGIWLQFSERGLRRQDMHQVHKELQQEPELWQEPGLTTILINSQNKAA